MIYMKPSSIYYSQDSIKNVFGDYCCHRGINIGRTLDLLVDGHITIWDFPTIGVMQRGGRWYTKDNRRLWIFRQMEKLGKCTEIPVEIGYIPDRKFTTTNRGEGVRVRGNVAGKCAFRKTETLLNSTIDSPRVTRSALPAPLFRRVCGQDHKPGTFRLKKKNSNLPTDERKPEQISNPFYEPVSPRVSRIALPASLFRQVCGQDDKPGHPNRTFRFKKNNSDLPTYERKPEQDLMARDRNEDYYAFTTGQKLTSLGQTLSSAGQFLSWNDRNNKFARGHFRNESVSRSESESELPLRTFSGMRVSEPTNLKYVDPKACRFLKRFISRYFDDGEPYKVLACELMYDLLSFKEVSAVRAYEAYGAYYVQDGNRRLKAMQEVSDVRNDIRIKVEVIGDEDDLLDELRKKNRLSAFDVMQTGMNVTVF